LSFVLGMAVIGAVGMVWIWAPAYPKPDRHEFMRAMDELERLYGEPDRYCPTGCGTWLPGDALWCSTECQALWMEDA
jgi:hypothetical protein